MAERAGPAAAILLAAGRSARLGRPKQLAEVQGESLLRRAVRTAHEAGASPIWVVLSPELAEAGRAALAGLDAVVLENPHPAEGMGSSLRKGMQALSAENPLPDRVLLLVCDQPLVTSEQLRRLLATPSPHGIVAAVYPDRAADAGDRMGKGTGDRTGWRTGVPAVFGSEHYAALAQMSGDSGARALLRRLPVTAFELPEASFDVDTPEQLRKLLQELLRG